MGNISFEPNARLLIVAEHEDDFDEEQAPSVETLDELSEAYQRRVEANSDMKARALMNLWLKDGLKKAIISVPPA